MERAARRRGEGHTLRTIDDSVHEPQPAQHPSNRLPSVPDTSQSEMTASSSHGLSTSNQGDSLLDMATMLLASVDHSPIVESADKHSNGLSNVATSTHPLSSPPRENWSAKAPDTLGWSASKPSESMEPQNNQSMDAAGPVGTEDTGYGTLVLSHGGRSKYLGPTAGSEWLKDVRHRL